MDTSEMYSMEISMSEARGRPKREGTRVLYNVEADKLAIATAIYAKAFDPEDTVAKAPCFWFIGYLLTTQEWSVYCDQEVVEDPKIFLELGEL